MLKLDHFVVHIDNNETLLSELKKKIEPLGFPFEPQWGKGTQGFKAANIWIGRQYFEIIRLLKPEGGGWVPRWVSQHQRGTRGLYCVFLLTDNIERVSQELRQQGVVVPEPERISFRAFFGLFKKTLPWKLIYLPPIPGTQLEIGFIEYDPDPKDRIKKYLVPNSDEKGIAGIHSATVRIPFTPAVVKYLQQILPEGNAEGDRYEVKLENGTLTFEHGPETTDVQLFAEVTNPKLKGNRFRLLNVAVQT